MTPRTDAKVFTAHWPISWCRSEEGPVVDATFARELETELIAAARGRCVCVGCGKTVNNAWCDADGHWCLTCLAKQRDALAVQVPPEPMNGTGWKS